MNIEELKKMKEKAKLTNQEIADLSGIPVSTVNKIFSGEIGRASCRERV